MLPHLPSRFRSHCPHAAGAATAGGGGGDTIVIGTKFDQPGLGLKNPDGTMSGFDVDVAKYVANELGFPEDKIEWKESPSAQRETLIQNDQVKFIAATYSITDSRKEKVDFAGPYLITGQSLLVRADNTDITGAASLQNNKKLCSVSGSTPAQRIKDKYPGVQLQQYDTYSACVEALKNGAVDAVTTDEVDPGRLRSADSWRVQARRRAVLGGALRHRLEEGRHRAADQDQRRHHQDGAGRGMEGGVGQEPRACRHRGSGAAADRQDERAAAEVEIFTEYRGPIFEAFWTTIQLTVFSAIGALILGTALAAMRLAPVPMLNWIGTSYVNVVRNTPLTLIILFCSFGLSQTLGITLVDSQSLTSIEDSNFRLAVLGFTVYTAAFVCETVRSGVNTVPLGQAEAARSLGLTFAQNLRIVLLPQAFRAVIIPLGSVLIALTKNTTIASAIGVAEAALLMKEMIENTAALVTVGTIFMLGFVILTLPTGLFFGWLGKRMAVAR